MSVGLLPLAARSADSAPASDAADAGAGPSPVAAAEAPIQQIEIVEKVKRLNEARTGIQTQTGASVYTVDQDAINAVPGGDNTLLNQVILQAPEVAQDSFGQFHVRGEHNGLQYRVNGIILPEGISVFGQSLDPRLISSMSLITGALPAEYGLRTAGIIDITTKNGALAPGGSVSIYGGSHGTVQPSFNYAGSSGSFNYFVAGDYLRSGLGIESPDGSSNPIHDDTRQHHGFAYLEDVLDADNRLALTFGMSSGSFQIPQQSGLQPTLGSNVNGQTTFPSENLDENQREITQFAILGWQHSDGPLDTHTALISRYSSLNFQPDPIGDLLYNGVSQQAYKRNVAFGLQSDAAYKLNDAHTVRAGIYLQNDRSTSLTSSLVLPVDSSGMQTSNTPFTVVDDGDKTERIESVYVQDEYRLLQTLTINFGGRFDHFTAFASGSQFSPRVNVVWQALADTTVHGGYSRYFSPPPFELVGSETVSKFNGTSNAPAVTQADTPKAERANYVDLGVEQKITGALNAAIDSYYKWSKDLIDEGQFGAPIILTPFNYRDGRQYGIILSANYAGRDLSAYANLAFQSDKGRGIESAQFNFSPDDLNYIATHYIDLDHEQRVTGSAGASYLWQETRFSADLLFGSGLRASTNTPNDTHLPYYTQVNTGVSHVFHIAGAGTLTARADVINVFDREYQIRNGTGVGVGAPQFGPRRGYFFGLSKSL
ncbi:MAG: TonB-dependent receptor [Betaproteobacteria bacterium]|nr:MAG: TonB-dependent receptor [Betaproteobacteria bacterium]